MIFSALCVPAFAAQTDYTDTAGHWAESHIDHWSDYGVIQGYNGEFNPDGSMTRAETAQIFANLLKLSGKADLSGYADVDPDAWYVNAIAACVDAGIMGGYNDEIMDPNGPISREMFFVMFARAMGISEEPAMNKDFNDGDCISDWASGYMNALVNAGYVGGVSDDTLAPEEEITRGSVVALLDKSVAGYANTDGAELAVEGNGIVLVVADNVTVTGSGKVTVIVADEGAQVSLKGFSGKTEVLVQADNVVLTDVPENTEVTVPENVAGTSANGTDLQSGNHTIPEVTETPSAPVVSGPTGPVISSKTLAEKIAEAESGATVTLTANESGAGVVIDKNITIDLGGHTYTFTSGVGSIGTESNGFQILQGNTVTLKNGTLTVAEANKADFYMLIQNYADLTITDMTLDGTYLDKYSTTDGDSYVLSNNCGTVSIGGNTNITANDEGAMNVAVDSCKYASYPAPTVTINTTGTIEGILEVTGGTMNIEAGTFNGAGDDGILWVKSGSAVVTGGLFEAELGANNYSMAVWAKGGEVTINGGSFKNATDGSARGTDLIYASAEGQITINGGLFEAADAQWTLNLKDQDRATASISVKGGTFKGFDPSNCASEGENTNFVAAGYEAVEENGVWTVTTVSGS